MITQRPNVRLGKQTKVPVTLSNCVTLAVGWFGSNSTGYIHPQATLRDECRVEQDSQARLRDLTENAHTGNSKIKSQMGLFDVYINNRVKWPQEFMLSGQNKERVTTSFPLFNG